MYFPVNFRAVKAPSLHNFGVTWVVPRSRHIRTELALFPFARLLAGSYRLL
jgi:hypothetical protein